MPEASPYQVVISPLARDDLTEIGDYIAKDSPANALAWVGTLEQGIESLEHMPGRFPLRDDLRPGYRVFSIGRYLIFYRIIGTNVEIARVIHGARDIENAFGARPA